MSAVTLETLRADFEAAQARKAGTISVDMPSINGAVITITARQVRKPNDDIEALDKAAELAGNTLNIAEKHGLQAAMLYKLSDGAIDPRNGGEA